MQHLLLPTYVIHWRTHFTIISSMCSASQLQRAELMLSTGLPCGLMWCKSPVAIMRALYAILSLGGPPLLFFLVFSISCLGPTLGWQSSGLTSDLAFPI